MVRLIEPEVGVIVVVGVVPEFDDDLIDCLFNDDVDDDYDDE